MFIAPGTSGNNGFGPDPLAEIEAAPRIRLFPCKKLGSETRSKLSRRALAHPAACMLSGAHDDAVSIARDLIRCPSVTPADAGALGVLEKALTRPASFAIA